MRYGFPEEYPAGVGDHAAARPSPDAASRLVEWSELHRMLLEVLEALAPFQAGIAAAVQHGLDEEVRRREMYVNWRPCQDRIFRLVEFSESVRAIGQPFRREARTMQGARWAVEIVGLQSLIEETIVDPGPLPNALVEFADDLRAACLRHLAIANREIRNLAIAGAEWLEAPGRSSR